MSKNFKEIVVDVCGDYAMFAPSYASAERVSYEVPTPSAMRNLLNAIYFKPTEFYYQITQIDVIKIGSTIPIMKNEVKDKVDVKKIKSGLDASIYPDDKKIYGGRGERTQRTYQYLKDVYYRIHAQIILKEQKEERVNLASITDQFYRRLENGKCFYQPFLGTRECMAFCFPEDKSKKPINVTRNYGTVLYDVFDPRTNVPFVTHKKSRKGSDVHYDGKTNITAYECVMVNGVIKVPTVEEVYKNA